MFVVTKQWIFNNMTEAGSWTYDQLRCLDVETPPHNGWIERSIGKQISDDKRLRFEKKLNKSQVKFGDCTQSSLL